MHSCSAQKRKTSTMPWRSSATASHGCPRLAHPSAATAVGSSHAAEAPSVAHRCPSRISAGDSKLETRPTPSRALGYAWWLPQGAPIKSSDYRATPFCAAPLSGRFDVGVQAEQVRRVVALLESDQAGVVVPVRRLDAMCM